MAQKSIWLNFEEAFSQIYNSDPAHEMYGWHTIGYASPADAKSILLNNSDTTASAIQFQWLSRFNGSYSQTGVGSDPLFGIPASVWTRNLKAPAGTTARVKLSGFLANRTVILKFGSAAFSASRKVSLTVGTDTAVFPNTSNAVNEEPVELVTTTDADGGLEILIHDDDHLDQVDLAFIQVTYSDGVGEEDYPIVTKRFVVDKFDTPFDGSEDLTVVFFDPTTHVLISETTTRILADGQFRCGTPDLDYGTTYRVGVWGAGRNWIGLLTTGV